MSKVTLYRPVNSVELNLIEKAGYTKFPPRLPEQPIFYPVTNIEYARKITKDWNVPAYGNGYVLEFDVSEEFLKDYKIQNVGGDVYDEYWIPSEEMDNFNNNIVGKIKIIEKYFGN
jgi:hypothetical protein